MEVASFLIKLFSPFSFFLVRRAHSTTALEGCALYSATATIRNTTAEEYSLHKDHTRKKRGRMMLASGSSRKKKGLQLTYLCCTFCHVKGGFCEKPYNLHLLQPHGLHSTLSPHPSQSFLSFLLFSLLPQLPPSPQTSGRRNKNNPGPYSDSNQMQAFCATLSSASLWLVLGFFSISTAQDDRTNHLVACEWS